MSSNLRRRLYRQRPRRKRKRPMQITNWKKKQQRLRDSRLNWRRSKSKKDIDLKRRRRALLRKSSTLKPQPRRRRRELIFKTKRPKGELKHQQRKDKQNQQKTQREKTILRLPMPPSLTQSRKLTKPRLTLPNSPLRKLLPTEQPLMRSRRRKSKMKRQDKQKSRQISRNLRTKKKPN